MRVSILQRALTACLVAAAATGATAAPAPPPPATYVGEVRAFAFNFCPQGWRAADGSLLPIAQNPALFSLLGTSYGGDGRTSFALPDLRGRTPIGTPPGQGQGGVSGAPPGPPRFLAMTWCIAVLGTYPPRS
jgi:microcystin-dependent protein